MCVYVQEQENCQISKKKQNTKTGKLHIANEANVYAARNMLINTKTILVEHKSNIIKEAISFS